MIKNCKLIFEDEYLVAIEKPAGVVVNRCDTVNPGETIQDWVETKLKIPSDINTPFGQKNGIVHRLDKETSGILLVAKNENIFSSLQEMFKNREVVKKYQVLVHGIVESSGSIFAPIDRAPGKGKFMVKAEGRESLTEFILKRICLFQPEKLPEKQQAQFKILARKNDLINFSLVNVILHTGRTHQIRVHFSHLKHPVAGDLLYGWQKNIKLERFWCPRQFLHAHYLAFTHPATGQALKLELAMPADLRLVLETYFI